MRSPDDVINKLNDLRVKLEQVNHAWTVKDSESLLKIFVDIIPKIMDAEVCSIFIYEQGTDKIWSKCGTLLGEGELIPPKEGTIVGKAISSGECIIKNDLEQSVYHKELASKTKFITRNLICAPIKGLADPGITGAIEVLNKKGTKPFSREEGELLQEIANCLSMAIENIIINQEILQISNQLNQAIEYIWEKDIEFIAKSHVMKNILNTVQVVSTSPVNVLLHGESGTGKEVIAQMIHKGSDRRDKPFVSVNCASIPENLLESEFFGYEKGAFTGAVTSRKGRFEEADGGILFLDEIGDMPLVIQPKFLRVTQEGEGSRLGSNKIMHYDLRFISATNKNLREEVAGGSFREDLFYRIFSVEIHVPPLRDRKEDIVPLAMFFLGTVSKRFKKRIKGFSSDVLNFFTEYPWPGNVRQLIHEVEHLVALTPEGNQILTKNFSQELKSWKNKRSIFDFKDQLDFSMPSKVKEFEIRCIKDALSETRGNKLRASRILGITRQGLDKKIKRYNINNSAENNK
jgi:transcriptional regulator with GAF, ATPase, and Fis domain